MWPILIFINIKTYHLWPGNLDYGIGVFLGIILPIIIAMTLQLLLGTFFVFKLNKNKSIKPLHKVLLALVTMLGLGGIFYIPSFIYMVIRLKKAKVAR